MADRTSACCGCLLGMAAGDALGFTIDGKTWEEILEDYGPNGLLGYDIVNGTVQVSSYTQVGAYVANGLLLGVTRGRPELFEKYIQKSLREWARRQDMSAGEPFGCWVAHVPALRAKHNRDGRMLDALRLQNLGTVDTPRNTNANPGSLIGAAMVGLAYDPARMTPEWITRTGAAAVAATHADPETYLTGAVLANITASIVQNPLKPFKEHFLLAIQAMDSCYRAENEMAASLTAKLKKVMTLPMDAPQQVMEQLQCSTAAQCLAGAMYACLVSNGDFDTALITAVNHSGKSAAVGAITGAMMGGYLGEKKLPDFYLEGLEVAPALRVLAKDLAKGSPAMGLFSTEWEQKYGLGRPPMLLN